MNGPNYIHELSFDKQVKLYVELITVRPDLKLPLVLREPERYEIQFHIIMENGHKGLIRTIRFDDWKEATRHYYILKEAI